MSQVTSKPEIEAEPPPLIKHLKWLLLYGRQYWKLLAVAVLFLVAEPIYTFLKVYYVANHDKPLPLGNFIIKVVNQTNDQYKIDNIAKLYLAAPNTPDMNKVVSTGVIRLNLEDGQPLVVNPGNTVSKEAALANEKRLLPYLEAGEYFGQIILTAYPRPISSNIMFSRNAFKDGVQFVVTPSHSPTTKDPCDVPWKKQPPECPD